MLKCGIRRLEGGRTASWIFRNAFFYLYWSNDTSVMSEDGLGSRIFPEFSRGLREVRPYLLTMTKTRRLKEFHKFGVRSKYLVRPRYADLLGNHRAWTHIDGGLSHLAANVRIYSANL